MHCWCTYLYIQQNVFIFFVFACISVDNIFIDTVQCLGPLFVYFIFVVVVLRVWLDTLGLLSRMGYFNIRNYLCSLLLQIVQHWTNSSEIRPLRLLHVFIFLFLFFQWKTLQWKHRYFIQINWCLLHFRNHKKNGGWLYVLNYFVQVFQLYIRGVFFFFFLRYLSILKWSLLR